MLLREVEYARPGSVEEAIRLLAGTRGRARARRRPDARERDEGARRVARRARRPEPARGAAFDLRLGRHARARGDGDLRADHGLVGGRRSRGRSSARSSPRSPTSRCETAARSAATSARATRRTTCRRCSSRSTRRSRFAARAASGPCAASEFFLGVYMTAVAEGELLVSISVPASAQRRRRLRRGHDRARGHVHRQRRGEPERRRRRGRDRLRRRGAGARRAGRNRAGRACAPPSPPRGSIRPPTSTPRPTTAVTSPRCARSAPSSRRAREGREVAEPSTSASISVEINGERLRARGRRAPPARPLHPRRRGADRHAHRLRHRQLRRLHDPSRRGGGEELHAARGPGRRREGRGRWRISRTTTG